MFKQFNCEVLTEKHLLYGKFKQHKCDWDIFYTKRKVLFNVNILLILKMTVQCC